MSYESTGSDSWFGTFSSLSAKARVKGRKGTLQDAKPKSGGGGGAFRAFLHERLKGVKFTGPLLRRAANEYRMLSDADKQYFQDIGAKATVAWRHGFAPFGERDRTTGFVAGASSAATATATDTSTSVELALVAEPPQSQPLIPFAIRDLKADVNLIRRRFRAERKTKRQALENQEGELLRTYKISDAEASPQVFGVERFFNIAHHHGPASAVDKDNPPSEEAPSLSSIKWFPPATEFSQAGYWVTDG